LRLYDFTTVRPLRLVVEVLWAGQGLQP